MDRRCPDCDATLESVEFMIQGQRDPMIRTGEKKDGLLGRLGVDDNKSVVTRCCPECGLLRFYAELED